MRTRLLSILSAGPPATKVRHYLGLPPQLTGGVDTRREMDPAVYLVIETWTEGTYLLRYDNEGNDAGDTWHRDVDEAKQQAEYEYEGRVGEWQDVPAEVEDAGAFGWERLKEASGR